MVIELFDDIEPDDPPRKVGFCVIQTARGSMCGQAIFGNDIESVELENKAGYVCGPHVDGIIASIFRGKVETLKPIPKTFRRKPRDPMDRAWTL